MFYNLLNIFRAIKFVIIINLITMLIIKLAKNLS